MRNPTRGPVKSFVARQSIQRSAHRWRLLHDSRIANWRAVAATWRSDGFDDFVLRDFGLQEFLQSGDLRGPNKRRHRYPVERPWTVKKQEAIPEVDYPIEGRPAKC